MVMQRYWWPGFEKHLLGKLQKQQNNAQFCDTLLQTEGIAVPTHSCVLAALSPYLSRKLSASPSPPSGQKHQLQLHAVKAKTLLKLVSLLYSGELEAKGSVEQNDIVALAHQFEIADFVESQKSGGLMGAEVLENRQCFCGEKGFHTEGRGTRDKRRHVQDAQVQTAFAERKDRDSPAEKRTTGTQTDKAGGDLDLSSRTSPPTAESAPSVEPSLDYSVPFPPQCLTLDNQFHFTSCSVIHSGPFRAPSSDSSSLDQPSGVVLNPTSTPALSSDSLTVTVSLNNNSNAPRHQEDGICQLSSEFEDSQVLAEDWAVPEKGKRHRGSIESRENTEQLSQPNEDEMPGRKSAKSRGMRPARASFGMKSPAKMKRMQEMMEDAHISIKVKLRRRTKGQVWEVVNMQDSEEAVSVPVHVRQDRSDRTRPNMDLPDVPPPPSTDQTNPVQNLDNHSPQPDANNSHRTAPHQNNSSGCFTSNQSNGLEGSPLLQCQGSVEESEQIEKLLEDIMMGLNILPNLESDCRKPPYIQPTALQVPVTHKDVESSRVQSVFSAAGVMQNCNSSADTGIQCCLTSENQPSCSGLSSAPPDAALIQQQQDCSSHYHSSVRSMWQRDGSSHQSRPLFNSQHPAAPSPRTAIPSAFFSPGQKMHFPAFPGSSTQDSQHNLGFLPLKNGKETHSMHNLSLLCMADMRLPQCLSPLSSLTNNHPSLVNPVNLGDKTQKQPSLYGRPWLTENPGTLKIPLGNVAQRKNTSASLTKDTNRSFLLKEQQDNLKMNKQNEGTCTESCTAKEVEETEKSAGQKCATEPKPEPRKKRKRCADGDGVAAKRKRKRPQVISRPPDAAAASVSEHKVSDATKSQINLSICQVSLSSNNVLAKEREMAASASNMLSKFVGKPNKCLLVADSLTQKSRPSRVTSNQNRIKTRGYLKKAQKSTSDTTNINMDVGVVPPSKTVEKYDKPDEGINDRIPEERKPSTINHPRVAILKEFQKLIKKQHSKTTKSKERQRRNKVGRAAESEVMASRDDAVKESSTEVNVGMTGPQDKSEETQEVFGVVFDKNHNRIFSESTDKKSKSQRDDTNSKDTCESHNEDRTAFLFDAMQEEVTKMAAERDDEGTTCVKRQMNTTQQNTVNDEGSSHSDLPLKIDLQQRTGPPLSEACGISRTSGCEEEEEEEEEVDVLLYSPVKTQTKEDGLQKVDISPDEEEEDTNEIDVTGDEAE